MKKKTGLLIAALVLGSVSTGILPAQTSKGSLAGTVRDKTGAVVANAAVTVKSEDTGETRKIKTTAQGAFRADAINPGRYTLHVEMSGFNALDVKGIAVEPSLVTTYDPQLVIGAVSADVSVEAISNSINTENGQLSGTIGTTELAKVPIFSLSPYELVATLPGVQLINPGLNLNQTGSGGNYESLSVNGARPRSNNYMLDSQDINDVGIGGQSFNPQVPDMYQSVTALTNSTSAEYGRSGGAVINLITKSGTNQFHGTLFELYSGSGLDALDGVTRQGKETPPYTPGYTPPQKARYDQHQYGFTAGGPLWKDKLFAFGGTQFSRYYGTSSTGSAIILPDAAGYATLTAIGKSATTPTAAAQVALLQGLLNNGSYLSTYANRNPTPTLPVSRLTVNGTNCPGGTGTCSVTLGAFQRPPVAQQNPDTQWLYRIDFIPHAADTFSFRYLHDRLTATPDLSLNSSGLPGFDGQVGGPAELSEGTWTHVFTSNLLNELRVSEVRLSDLFAATPETAANPLAKIANISLTGSSLPVLGVSQNIPQGRKQELYQLQDAVSWIKGRQSLRFGFDIGRDLEIDLVSQNALGSYTFAATDANNSALDNFLRNQLGRGGNVSRTFGPTRLDPHLWKIAGFAQDDIKLTPELTINLGIRYDYDTNPENALAYPAVDVTNPYQSISAVVPVQADRNNVAPRFGFAYNPHFGSFSEGKTVFHGGFGIFYDVDFTNIIINSVQSGANAPTGSIVGLASNNNGANATALFGTITPALTPLSGVISVANNMVNPMTYQYNFGVEQEMPGQIKLGINYVGALGRNLFATVQLNPIANGVRLNPARGPINIRNNAADSSYNSAQVQVSRAFRNGLSFRASYAFSKLLDDTSEVFQTFSNPNTPYGANLQNIHQEYSNSSFDRRHVASFEYVYSPAGFHASNSAADALLEAFTRHFIVSGTTQFSSGPYSSFQIAGFDINGDGNPFNDRPLVGNLGLPITAVGADGYYLPDILDAKGNTIAPANVGTLYDLATYNSVVAKNPHDPSALKVVIPSQERFIIQPGSQATTPQEVGRNSFENPGQSFWNLALEKDIPLGFKHVEHGQFVLRAEAQNIGNHNNVSTLDTNLLDLGTNLYLNKALKRESTNQHYRLWAKYIF